MKPKSYVIAGIIAALGAIASLGVGITHRDDKKLVAGLLALWAILPPVYFFFEFQTFGLTTWPNSTM